MDANGLETQNAVDFINAQLAEFNSDVANDAAGLSAFQDNFTAALNTAQTELNSVLNASDENELVSLDAQYLSGQTVSALTSSIQTHLGKAFGDAHPQAAGLCVLNTVYSSGGGATVGYTVIGIPTRFGLQKLCLFVPASIIQAGPTSGTPTETSGFGTPCDCVATGAPTVLTTVLPATS